MSGTALHFLRGARVQRVDVPRPGLLCLTLYAQRARQHLLLPFDGRDLPQLAAERPRGDAASGLVQRLRKRLQGARMAHASWRGSVADKPSALLLTLEGARPGALCVVLDPRCANLVCLDEANRAIVAADVARLRGCGAQLGKPYVVPPEAASPPFPDDAADWQRPQDSADSPAGPTPAEQARLRALREARKRLHKIERKLAAIDGDLQRAATSDRLRDHAQRLLCHLDAVPRGVSEVELPGPDPDAGSQRIALDPALDAVGNAERLFQRARRYERGLPIARAHRARTEEQRGALAELVERLSEPGADAGALAPEASRDVPTPGPRKGPAARRPYRAFESEPPFRVLVGRSAADNDALTLHHARPLDLWLHVRDSPGAHVVVPLQRGQHCPERVRLDAALLAAHFSPQAGEDRVDVSVCERRYVRKRRGSPPGSVQVDREKVLPLRADPERVRWLLSREIARGGRPN